MRTSGGAWTPLLREYQTYQRAAGLAPGTIRLHAYRIVDLSIRLDHPGEVTTEILLALLAVPHWKPETRRSVRSTFRSFFRWAFKAGRLTTDPSEGLPTVRVPRTIPRPTPEHVVRAGTREVEPREAFMVRLGAFAGLRCCEIALVHESNWDGLRLRVTGKGGTQRVVPIAEPELRRDLDAVRGWAFPNRWTGDPLTPGHVSRLLSRGLAETWTGHTLRHRFGTRACNGTRDIQAVAEVMGHARLETTRIYAQIADERLLAVAAAVVA